MEGINDTQRKNLLALIEEGHLSKYDLNRPMCDAWIRKFRKEYGYWPEKAERPIYKVWEMPYQEWADIVHTKYGNGGVNTAKIEAENNPIAQQIGLRDTKLQRLKDGTLKLTLSDIRGKWRSTVRNHADKAEAEAFLRLLGVEGLMTKTRMLTNEWGVESVCTLPKSTLNGITVEIKPNGKATVWGINDEDMAKNFAYAILIKARLDKGTLYINTTYWGNYGDVEQEYLAKGLEVLKSGVLKGAKYAIR